jgi:hypothetical protein
MALEEFGFHRSSIIKHLRGRTDWGVMSRAGFADPHGSRPSGTPPGGS